MGEIKQFKPVKLVICILISDLKIKPELLNLLEALFGKIDFEFLINDHIQNEIKASAIPLNCSWR